MNNRVVITGIGVVAPNGSSVGEFREALIEGRSGIRKVEGLAEHGFQCQVGGVPQGAAVIAERLFTEEQRLAMNGNMTYACIAASEAWEDAGLTRPDPADDTVDWHMGAVIGTGIGGLDTVAERIVPLTDAGKVRRLGSTCVEQVMSSNVSAKIGGLFGLGNRVTTNSSACTTGTEAIYDAFCRVRSGAARRMLAGSSEGHSHYIWAGFDAMRVLARGFNDTPEEASRPMSASASGFVPGSGAGVLVLESLESALERGADIRAEILGGDVNCGGHRMGGSRTAPNPTGVKRCIRSAMEEAGIESSDVDAISGHLTATIADPLEIRNWAEALGCDPEHLPPITATKSLIGHALGAAGSIEAVAAVLMLERGFLHAARNCDDLHPDIQAYAGAVPHETRELPEMRTMIKAGFGFGDVNGCLVLRKWDAATLN